MPEQGAFWHMFRTFHIFVQVIYIYGNINFSKAGTS